MFPSSSSTPLVTHMEAHEPEAQRGEEAKSDESPSVVSSAPAPPPSATANAESAASPTDESCSYTTRQITAAKLTNRQKLLHLNADVLLSIIHMLSSDGYWGNRWVRALSETCSYMRGFCMSALFKSCTVTVYGPLTVRRLPPSTVWSHIRDLRFHNEHYHQELRQVVDYKFIYDPPGPVQYIAKPSLGSLFDGLFLDEQLRNMRNLRSICVYGQRDGVYDISLPAMKAILSMPMLREFTLVNHEIYPSLDGFLTPDAKEFSNLAPITSFVYDTRMAGVPPGYPADVAQRALAALLPALAPSLQTLCLPSIYVPVDSISETHWPLLREFTVRGKHLDFGPSKASYACLFAKMPNLRALNLQVANPPETAWSVEHLDPFPSPMLEHLTLSQPCPDDVIYSHLPTSIRSLSLHSWPPQAYNVYLSKGTLSLTAWPRLSPGAPVPASLMLRVLRACNSVEGHLTRLHVEYVEDDDEGALLQHIASAFPSLTMLEIHRRRAKDTDEDPGWTWDTLGKACASLKTLRDLYVQADIPTYPDRLNIPKISTHYADDQHRSYAETRLLGVASALARTLPPSVKTLGFITPDNFWPRWAVYSVRDGADGMERVAKYECHRPAEGGAGHSFRI